MIQFALRCADDHRFDSWFQSADAFEKLRAAGMINFAVCGTGDIEKAVMAPRVQAGRGRAAKPLTQESDPKEKALAEIRKHIEQNSEYVGMNFAREARDIHDGLAPGRAIHGEARPEEARKLVEDGVPVAPLPFISRNRTN